ncbi:AraC family transcriptional regulator [Paenibacillus sp. y28]|uniref:AraC family transcriptional regulator n=1 Tax=Paenibacillus sp. y28 TaxID=3129110 RepID=UPI00301A4459
MEDLFSIEKMRRSGPFSMPINHYHAAYEIYYLLSGERYYFIKDRTFHVRKGDLVFIGGNVLHKTSVCGDIAHERILLNFKPAFLPYGQKQLELLLSPFEAELPVLSLNPLEQITVESWLQHMLDEQQSNEPAEITGILLQSLLAQLLVFSGRAYAQKHIPAFEHVSPQHRKISEVVDFINAHYDHSLQLQDIGDRFYISRFHLSRLFKEVTGFTFVEYVNTVRVKEAQRQLRDTGEQIIHIAERSGFENVSHFCRVFRQISGTSPSQYRKLHEDRQTASAPRP